MQARLHMQAVVMFYATKQKTKILTARVNRTAIYYDLPFFS